LGMTALHTSFTGRMKEGLLWGGYAD